MVAQGGWNGVDDVDDVDEDEFCLIVFVPFSGFYFFLLCKREIVWYKVVGSI